MDAVRSLLCDIWNGLNAIQPVFAFAIGLLGAYVVVWLNHLLRDDLLRRATRESLAIELLTNLQLLDAYQRDLLAASAQQSQSWPSEPPVRRVLDNTGDPLVVAVLTDTEKVRLALLATQLDVLWTALVIGREDVERPTAHRQFPSRGEIAASADKILDSRVLEESGRLLLETLLTVMSKQDYFSLSAIIEMAQHLEGKVVGSAVWRTSDLRRWPAKTGVAVAWKDDSPEAANEAPVIVLWPERIEVMDIVDLEQAGWLIRYMPFYRRWRSYRGHRADTRTLERVRNPKP